MGKSASWSVVGLASVLAAFVSVGACGSDDDPPAPGTPDGGGSGGRGGSSGRGGSGGLSGAGGAGDASDAGSCTTAVATACDGPEDCPSGQRCCGKWDQEYVEFGCFTSCIAQAGDAAPGPGGGPLWFDMCHPGDACEDSTAMCLTSPYLPSSFARCYDSGDPPNPSLGKAANAVNCGTDVCGSGEKCCLRGTLEPYCTPSSATCVCDPPDAGSDAGSDSGDAAPDSSQDAAPDSSQDAAPDSNDAAPSDAAPDATDATAD